MTESILTSYFEVYVRRLLPVHQFSEDIFDLLYSNLSEEQLRTISVDLLGVLAQKTGRSTISYNMVFFFFDFSFFKNLV